MTKSTITKKYPFVENILWSIPEQKTGSLQVIGGNIHAFATEIRLVEYLNTLPIKTIRLSLPDALQKQLPPTPEISFTKSTPSGSFDKSPELNTAATSADLVLLSGDVSKNSATTIALAEAVKNTAKPVVITRDAVDCLTSEISALLESKNRIYFATMAQLQKLFRSALYPKMLLLSMPLPPVLETLHKFTLSYPATIITFHSGQVIFAHAGQTLTLPLSDTNYTPISLWAGTLAAKIAALNLWTPNQPLEASFTAFFYK